MTTCTKCNLAVGVEGATCAGCYRRGLEQTVASQAEEIEGLQEANASQTYAGNSISYIHDKMRCYKDQVGMAFAALRTLGYVDNASDNVERQIDLEQWAEEHRAELAALAPTTEDET